MSPEIAPDLWKMLTSTVGLVSVRYGTITNVMSAEWSYFLNKRPLYAAVVLSPLAGTRELLTAAGEFSLTFCGEEQAELADFAGSFSIREIDKCTSELVHFGEPERIRSPWVTGGLLALECEVRQTVDLPVHTMYVGEVVAAHPGEAERRPLVKHGRMHTLGDPVQRTAVAAAAQIQSDGALRVAATGPDAMGADVWRVSLLLPDGEEVPLGDHPSAERGDFLVDLVLPSHLPAARLTGARIRVERAGAKAGYARIAGEVTARQWLASLPAR